MGTLVPDDEITFDSLRTFDSYADYNLIVGNGIAREKLKEIQIIEDVRAFPVKMTITQADADGKFYFDFLQFRDFREAKKIITDAGSGLIHPKSKSLLQGKRQHKTSLLVWRAWIVTDTRIQHGVEVMVFTQRPSHPDHPFKDVEMPAAAKEGQVLQSKFVYYKIALDLAATKNQVKAPDKVRYKKETKGDEQLEVRRSVLCGPLDPWCRRLSHHYAYCLRFVSNKSL